MTKRTRRLLKLTHFGVLNPRQSGVGLFRGVILRLEKLGNYSG
jgi:hypothetical protein